MKAEEGDPDSLLMWYTALIRLKKTNRALEDGADIMLDTENTKVLSWMRQAAGAPAVVVCVNFTAQPQTVNLANDALGAGTHKLKTLLKTPGAVDSPSLDRIQLGPFGVYVGEVQ